jgi:predicted nucleic acid-binding protein
MTFALDVAPVVVDASVAVELVAGRRPDVPAVWRSWLAADRMLLAPAVHWTEVGHVLLRHAQQSVAAAATRLDELIAAGVETADRGPGGVRAALELAARHRLSVYDATYLWLAMDIDAELATLDRDLARAATAEGVPLAIKLDD